MNRLNTQAIKRLFSIGILLAGILGSFAVSAGGSSNKANIITLQVFNGGAYVRLDPAVAVNPDSCPNFSGWYIFLDKSLDANENSFKEYYAAILSAYTLSKKITVYANGCYNGYPKGQGVTISN